MSTPATIETLARRLIAGEASADPIIGDARRAARACERLRFPLTKLAGSAGFSSLLWRAVAVGRRQAPYLQQVRVEPDGSLTGFDETPEDSTAAAAARHGGMVLLAELLGLLVTLIGEPLTLRLVREAWPDISIEIHDS